MSAMRVVDMVMVVGMIVVVMMSRTAMIVQVMFVMMLKRCRVRRNRRKP